MSAPVNVKLENPTISIKNWKDQKKIWIGFNASIGGNPDLFPLTIKAFYVLGIIHDLFSCVNNFFYSNQSEHEFILPAFTLLSSAVDLIGRVVKGNETYSCNDDLLNGYKYLFSSKQSNIRKNFIAIKTNKQKYTIEDLIYLRNFSAHGQAALKNSSIPLSFDTGILVHYPNIFAEGLEFYWSELQKDETLCNNLAKSNIYPMRIWPVLKTFLLFSGSWDFEDIRKRRNQSMYDIFKKFKWWTME